MSMDIVDRSNLHSCTEETPARFWIIETGIGGGVRGRTVADGLSEADARRFARERWPDCSFVMGRASHLNVKIQDQQQGVVVGELDLIIMAIALEPPSPTPTWHGLKVGAFLMPTPVCGPFCVAFSQELWPDLWVHDKLKQLARPGR